MTREIAKSLLNHEVRSPSEHNTGSYALWEIHINYSTQVVSVSIDYDAKSCVRCIFFVLIKLSMSRSEAVVFVNPSFLSTTVDAIVHFSLCCVLWCITAILYSCVIQFLSATYRISTNVGPSFKTRIDVFLTPPLILSNFT